MRCAASTTVAGISGMPGYWQLMQLQHLYRMGNFKLAQTKYGFAYAALGRLCALSYMVTQIHSQEVKGAILPILIFMVAQKKIQHVDKLLLATAAWLAFEKSQMQTKEDTTPAQRVPSRSR